MSVLVVDPSKEFRETALNLVKWVDRRHSVELAEDGASGWKTALEWRPELILCEPSLPDIRGEKLCERLRARLPKTTFIAYSTDNRMLDPHLKDVFDGVLSKPPSRFAVLSYLHAAKKQKRRAEITRSPRENAEGLKAGGVKSAAEQTPHDLFRPVHIFVGLAQENDLRFGVPVPEGSTIGAVFRQIGKASVTWFTLLREGRETDAGLHTRIREGDVLLIKT